MEKPQRARLGDYGQLEERLKKITPRVRGE